VILGLQNHHRFSKDRRGDHRVIEAIDSKWFGSILDIGSLRRATHTKRFEKLVPYAVSWQIKESVYYGKDAPVDLHKVREAIERRGYRGLSFRGR